MKWPQHLDYLEAIQHPAFCFAVESLRAAKPVCDRFGVPRAASGNFACVFQVVDGRERWAVRCFTRQVPDVRRRYAALARHLSSARLACLVEFTYLEEGIRIRNHWHPIVRMEWVDGVTLPKYVEAHLGQGPTLRRLAEAWTEVARELRDRRIAHGDLQHGNVLVMADGRIRLVDYDAMYIPAFRGEPSPELGHPNWQHPRRTERDYDEDLDGFASLVLELSLQALAADPSLWSRYHNGENLLFTRQDFEQPDRSELFRRLTRHPDRQVGHLARELENRCTRRSGGWLNLRRTERTPPAPAMGPPPEMEAPPGIEGEPPGAARPWAGARQLGAVARELLPQLGAAAWACFKTLARLPFSPATPATVKKPQAQSEPKPTETRTWWRGDRPEPAPRPASPGAFWIRWRTRLKHDRDLALLVWVCAGCALVDAGLLVAWWWRS